jgi:hypothetical protein
VAITTKAQLIAAISQTVYIDRGSVAATQGAWNTNFAATIGGVGLTNGAPVFAGTSTAQGVVPDSTTPGFPPIRAFRAGNVGYLAEVDFTDWAGTGRIRLCDQVFKCGAYNFNDSVTLASQPSFASRMPGGQYAGRTELWFECVTAFTGNPTIVVTYTNQDGVAGQTTTLVQTVAPIANRVVQFPLAAGDTGIQKIESVTASVATAGTFNLIILRPLWNGRNIISDSGGRYVQGPDKTGLPIMFSTCALMQMMQAEGASNTGSGSMTIKIIEG